MMKLDFGVSFYHYYFLLLDFGYISLLFGENDLHLGIGRTIPYE